MNLKKTQQAFEATTVLRDEYTDLINYASEGRDVLSKT